MSSERTTISMPADLYARAIERQKALGYSTFSDYIQALVRADAMSQAAHIREPSVPYRTAADTSPTKTPSDNPGSVVEIVKKHHPVPDPAPAKGRRRPK